PDVTAALRVASFLKKFFRPGSTRRPPERGPSVQRMAMGSAAIAVRITRHPVLHAVPGVLHGFLGFLPRQARLALRALPTLLEPRFGVRIPVRARREAARLRAIAIGRTVVLVVEVLLVIRGLVVVFAEVLVGGLVGAEGTVGAVPGIAYGRLGLLPVQRRLAARLVPTRLQLGFGIVPVALAGLVAVFGAQAVGGRVVAVEVGVGAVVLAAGRVLTPVLDFGGGVDAFGDRLAARRAADGADAAAD